MWRIHETIAEHNDDSDLRRTRRKYRPKEESNEEVGDSQEEDDPSEVRILSFYFKKIRISFPGFQKKSFFSDLALWNCDAQRATCLDQQRNSTVCSKNIFCAVWSVPGQSVKMIFF